MLMSKGLACAIGVNKCRMYGFSIDYPKTFLPQRTQRSQRKPTIGKRQETLLSDVQLQITDSVCGHVLGISSSSLFSVPSVSSVAKGLLYFPSAEARASGTRSTAPPRL